MWWWRSRRPPPPAASPGRRVRSGPAQPYGRTTRETPSIFGPAPVADPQPHLRVHPASRFSAPCEPGPKAVRRWRAGSPLRRAGPRLRMWPQPSTCRAAKHRIAVIVVSRQLPGRLKMAGCSVPSAVLQVRSRKLLDHSPDVGVRMLGMYGRALSFGVVAEAYERFRPAYPVELFDMVMAYAGQPVRTALEIGAGTGKATRLFAQRGVTVTAVEPDGAML